MELKERNIILMGVLILIICFASVKFIPSFGNITGAAIEGQYKFGGMYTLINGVCENPNPITDACSCPSIYFSALAIGNTYYCYNDRILIQVLYDFGGVFSKVDGECTNPNIGVNTCVCPLGYSISQVIGDSSNTGTFFCYRNHQDVEYDFGGMYSLVDRVCQIQNKITGACECPSGYSSFQATGTNFLNGLFYCYKYVGEPLCLTNSDCNLGGECINGICVGGEPEEPGELICIDTDDGIDYYTAGEVIYTDGKERKDMCSPTPSFPNYMIEWSCVYGMPATAGYVCPGGCEDGACIGIECLTNSDCGAGEECIEGVCSGGECVDTDSGKDYYTAGTVTFPGGHLNDYCYDETHVLEGYCLDEPDTSGWTTAYHDGELYECPTGCSDGACNLPCSLDATGCTELNYPQPLCGLTSYDDVWDGYKFELQKVCIVDEGGGRSSTWSFDQPSCAVISECPTGCSDGACITPSVCSLSDAYWNPDSAEEGDTVELRVVGTLACDGETTDFVIKEDDVDTGYSVGSCTFDNVNCVEDWDVEYEPEDFGYDEGDVLEFTFTATVDSLTRDSDVLEVGEEGFTPSGDGDIGPGGYSQNEVDTFCDGVHSCEDIPPASPDFCTEYDYCDICPSDNPWCCGWVEDLGCFTLGSIIEDFSLNFDCPEYGKCKNGKQTRAACACTADDPIKCAGAPDFYTMSHERNCAEFEEFPFFDNFSLLVTVMILGMFYFVRKKFYRSLAM